VIERRSTATTTVIVAVPSTTPGSAAEPDVLRRSRAIPATRSSGRGTVSIVMSAVEVRRIVPGRRGGLATPGTSEQNPALATTPPSGLPAIPAVPPTAATGRGRGRPTADLPG
jgi:hypothetical protein